MQEKFGVRAKKTIKRIAALAAGATLLGATLLTPVLAGNLANLPAPFVQNGNFDAYIVIGEHAQTIDVAGAIELAAAFAQKAYAETTVQVEGATVEGVSGGVLLETDTAKLYLGSNINSAKDILTSSDLNILARGSVEDNESNTYTYDQYIELKSKSIAFGQVESGEDPVIYIDLGLNAQSSPVYVDKIVFNKAPDITKLGGSDITLFGKKYTISSDSTATKLILYGAAAKEMINKGETKTITVSGTDYDVTLVGFDATANNHPRIRVENKATGTVDEATLDKGDSRTIAGLSVYIEDFYAEDTGSGLTGYVWIQAGSQKVILEDGSAVKVGDNEETIDGTYVSITRSGNQISVVKVSVAAQDSDSRYLKDGSEFTDPVFGTFKIALKDVDFKSGKDEIKIRTSGDNKLYVEFANYNGVTKSIYFFNQGNLKWDDYAFHVVENDTIGENEYFILTSGDARYAHLLRVKDIKVDSSSGYVEFTDVFSGDTYKTVEGEFDSAGDKLDLIVDGKTYYVWLASATAGSEKIKVEYPDSYKYVYPAIDTSKGAELAFTKKDAILGDPGSSSGGANWNISLPTGNVVVTFTTGATNNVAFSSGTLTITENTTTGTGTLSDTGSVGNVEYKFSVAFTNGQATQLNISLTDQSGTALQYPAIILREEKDDQDTQNVVIVSTEYTSSDAGVYGVHMTDSNAYTSISTSDDNINAYYDYYGTYVEVDSSDSSQKIATIYYPDNQVSYKVAVGENPEFTTTSGGGEYTTIEINPVSFPIAMLDSEVDTSTLSKPVILVGGPVVNSLVAELANEGKTMSADDWRAEENGTRIWENKAIVKLIDDAFNGQAALIVAGYSGEDTLKAARALATYILQGENAPVTFSGEEVKLDTSGEQATLISTPQSE